MSHIPERKEKDCLNCGTIVHGRFCHACGQENVVPKETFWHMVTHFFNDITHFDSSFFHTVRQLAFKPGFLTSEYMKGKRARYLHPIRMYVFSSAVFFLLLFSVFKPVTVERTFEEPVTREQRAEYVERLQKELARDTANLILKERLLKAQDTSRVLVAREMMSDSGGLFFQVTSYPYKSEAEFDSMQNALPPSERYGWFMRRLVKKQIEINTKYTPKEAFEKFTKSLMHRLPYMLFVSLPLFALILKLVYIRRKPFYYADHGVFTIHLYIFTFLVLMVIFGLDKLDDLFHKDLFTWVNLILFLSLFVYLYKAMRRFYGQGRGKTIAKFLIVAFLSLVMMALLFVAFMLFSAVTF